MNQYLIAGVIAGLLVAFLGGIGLGWHERAIRVPAELEAQQTADQKTCSEAQQLTKDANDELQKDRDTIAANLSAYKLRVPASCVRVSSRPKLPSTGTKHAGSNGAGLSSDWLRTYAATAETYRSELGVCIDFLHQERQTFKPN
jgi:hypothetical protein